MAKTHVGAAMMSRAARKNPVELCEALMDRYPHADFSALYQKWAEIVRDDEEYLEPVLLRTFANVHAQVERGKMALRTVATSERPLAAKPLRQAVVHLTEKIRERVLLDLTLPKCGKKLRYATFAECLAEGQWFAKIAAKGKPHEIVGQVLSEEQIRALK